MESLSVNGVEFIAKPVEPTGTRAVVVVDRGWIFAGDVRREDGRIYLTQAVLVDRWEQIGFYGMIATPLSEKVTLRLMSQPVEIPAGAEIFSVPVPDDWGL